MRISDGLASTLKASLSIGTTGIAIGKMVMGMTILSVVWIPAGTSAVTLFFMSVVPGLVFFGILHLLESESSRDPNLTRTKKIVVNCAVPMFFVVKISNESNIPILNIIALSTVAVFAAALITVPVVESVVEFTTYTVPHMFRG